MKVTLKPEVVQELEDLTGKKMIRNGNEIISQVCDMADAGCIPRDAAWLEPDPEEEEEKKDA